MPSLSTNGYRRIKISGVVLLLTTSGSAKNTVKKPEEKRPEDGAGHGQLAWKVLTEKYNGHFKEARKACHEKLVNAKMDPGQDPDDLFFVLDECRDLLEGMRRTVHDERRDFGLDDIRCMVHTMYVDNLSRSINAKPIAGRGIAMQVVGHTSSDVQCNYCKGFGHVTQDCVILKKEHRRRPNPGGQQHQRKQYLPRHGKTGSGDARRGGDLKSVVLFPSEHYA